MATAALESGPTGVMAHDHSRGQSEECNCAEERQRVRQQLEEYCGRDAIANRVNM